MAALEDQSDNQNFVSLLARKVGGLNLIPLLFLFVYPQILLQAQNHEATRCSLTWSRSRASVLLSPMEEP